ncbi:hypothetical protein OG21DRAFT_1524617, partial [Imleria badia]
MTTLLSETSENYPVLNIDLVEEPAYPQELLIPLISLDLTKSQPFIDQAQTLKLQWKTHFCQQQLQLQHKLRDTTYHWVAHLLTDHPTQIYHPTFGLTLIAESARITETLSIPRQSLTEVIVIPAATACNDCTATCRLIQGIESEQAENSALEEYTTLALNTSIALITAKPPIEIELNASPGLLPRHDQPPPQLEVHTQHYRTTQPFTWVTTATPSTWVTTATPSTYDTSGEPSNSTDSTGNSRATAHNTRNAPATTGNESTSISGTMAATAPGHQ